MTDEQPAEHKPVDERLSDRCPRCGGQGFVRIPFGPREDCGKCGAPWADKPDLTEK